MLRNPSIRPGFQFEIVGSGRVLLRSETRSFWLEGGAYPLVLPQVDGRRTSLDIAAALAGRMPPEHVHFTLAMLEKRGFLVESRDTGAPSPASAYWASLDLDPGVACSRIANASVSVTSFGVGRQLEDTLRSAFDSWGLRDIGSSSSVAIVIAAEGAEAALAQYNRDRLSSRLPWIVVRPMRRIAFIGPLFQPGITGCWECLAHRLQENRMTAPGPSAGPPSDSTVAMVLHLAATELARWIASGDETSLNNALLTFDVATSTRARHPFTRRPQCPACGDTTTRAMPPLVLHEQGFDSDSDGGYRSCSADKTMERLAKHISPITGIIPSIETRVNQPGSPAVFASRLNGPLGTQHGKTGRTLAVAGKGMTPQQSRVSCAAEAVERYSACFQGSEARIAAPYQRLGPAAVHPCELLHFSAGQYLARNEWNQRYAGRYWIPEPYQDHEEIDWTQCWSLISRSPRYVPTSFCYLDYPRSGSGRFCAGDSNGCAAGNTIEEAILQGFFELVERDATAVWWYNRVQRPAPDLASFDDPNFIGAADRLRSRGRTLHLLDITTGLEIPTFVAVSANLAGNGVSLGFGSHLEARIAASRAIAEVHQSISWKQPPNGLVIDAQPHLKPAPQAAPMWPPQDSYSVLEALLECVENVRRRGLDFLVLDLTRPDIGFPVVKVIVPGLRHYYPRFAPGRLYQVPVDLQWLPQPLVESALNPAMPPT